MSRHDVTTDDRSPWVSALLQAAASEVVPPESRNRVAQQLGLAIPHFTPSAALAAAPRVHAKRASWAKMMLFGVAGALYIGGGAPRVEDQATPIKIALEGLAPVPVPEEAAPSAVPAPVLDNAELRPPEPLRVRPPLERPVAKRVAVHPGTPALAVVPASHPAARSTSNLLAEVRELDAVRALLREHRATPAIERLEAYSRAFPNGELALEASVLKVQALFEAERVSEARTLARVTLARAGSERYQRELRDVLEASDHQ